MLQKCGHVQRNGRTLQADDRSDGGSKEKEVETTEGTWIDANTHRREREREKEKTESARAEPCVAWFKRRRGNLRNALVNCVWRERARRTA